MIRELCEESGRHDLGWKLDDSGWGCLKCGLDIVELGYEIAVDTIYDSDKYGCFIEYVYRVQKKTK